MILSCNFFIWNCDQYLKFSKITQKEFKTLIVIPALYRACLNFHCKPKHEIWCEAYVPYAQAPQYTDLIYMGVSRFCSQFAGFKFKVDMQISTWNLVWIRLTICPRRAVYRFNIYIWEIRDPVDRCSSLHLELVKKSKCRILCESDPVCRFNLYKCYRILWTVWSIMCIHNSNDAVLFGTISQFRIPKYKLDCWKRFFFCFSTTTSFRSTSMYVLISTYFWNEMQDFKN